MECTLAALIACFSWSNLYVDVGADFIKDRDRQYTESFYGETFYVMPTNGNEPFLERHVIRQIDSIEREVFSPYIRPALGYEIDAGRMKLDFSVFYQESARVSDRGEYGASIRLRVHPFGGRR
jgi:hypothetical protein